MEAPVVAVDGRARSNRDLINCGTGILPVLVLPGERDHGLEARATVGGARRADIAVGEDAVAAVEPAVGAPDETVECLVRVLVAPAIEEDLRRAVGLVVAVLVRDVHQIGGRADIETAEAEFDAADEV